MTRQNGENRLSRRTVLKSSAALTAAGLAPTVGAQEAFPSEIELGGRTSGWIGQSPDEITDERNPTLRLEAGQEYTLTWENLDGAQHNFNIEDEGGNDLVSTDLFSESGETQTVEFTAEEAMAEYYCGPHPSRCVAISNSSVRRLTARKPPNPRNSSARADRRPGDRGRWVDCTGDPPSGRRRRRPPIHRRPDGVHLRPRRRRPPGGAVPRRLGPTRRIPRLRRARSARTRVPPRVRGERSIFRPVQFATAGGHPEEYDHTFVLSEFRTADEEHSTADPDSERTLLEIPEPQFNHNSGPIAFGPDGYLYVATGDGGGANDTGTGHVEDWYDENEGGNGQDTAENFLGGILRLDVDVDGETSETSEDGGDAEGDERAYGIPDDNPLVDMDGHRDEYYAWGMRNPWGGMSFTGDGEFLMADVGQNRFESVNHVQRGGNYSWNVKEGTHCFSTETPSEPAEDCPESTPEDVRGGEELLDPVIEYPHDLGLLESAGAENEDGDDAENGNETGSDGEPVGVSITGGYLYAGGEIDELENTYVFGDWSRDGEDQERCSSPDRPRNGSTRSTSVAAPRTRSSNRRRETTKRPNPARGPLGTDCGRSNGFSSRVMPSKTGDRRDSSTASVGGRRRTVRPHHHHVDGGGRGCSPPARLDGRTGATRRAQLTDR